MIINDIIKGIYDYIEDFRTKEYVCYYKEKNLTCYDCEYFTKNQLIEFINEHQLQDLEVYKIDSRIKIKRTLEIEEPKIDKVE